MNVEPGTSNVGGYGRHMAAIGLFSEQYKREETIVMAESASSANKNPSGGSGVEVKEYTYDRWMESTGIPIHRGYFIQDLRTVELGWWEERGCEAAFVQLVGQEGITSATVMEGGVAAEIGRAHV